VAHYPILAKTKSSKKRFLNKKEIFNKKLKKILVLRNDVRNGVKNHENTPTENVLIILIYFNTEVAFFDFSVYDIWSNFLKFN